MLLKIPFNINQFSTNTLDFLENHLEVDKEIFDMEKKIYAWL